MFVVLEDARRHTHADLSACATFLFGPARALDAKKGSYLTSTLRHPCGRLATQISVSAAPEIKSTFDAKRLHSKAARVVFTHDGPMMTFKSDLGV